MEAAGGRACCLNHLWATTCRPRYSDGYVLFLSGRRAGEAARLFKGEGRGPRPPPARPPAARARSTRSRPPSSTLLSPLASLASSSLCLFLFASFASVAFFSSFYYILASFLLPLPLLASSLLSSPPIFLLSTSSSLRRPRVHLSRDQQGQRDGGREGFKSASTYLGGTRDGEGGGGRRMSRGRGRCGVAIRLEFDRGRERERVGGREGKGRRGWEGNA